MVSAVMALLATTLAALAATVQVSSEQQMGQGLAMQHGHVAIERIERAIRSATANEQFPGFTVIGETVNGWTFPDTLVVWKPTGAPADPDGLPRVNELVVFSPAHDDPTQLVERRYPEDASEVPPLINHSDWDALIAMLESSPFDEPDSNVAVLTNLLRVAEVTDSPGGSLGRRGCVRFEQVLRPSDSQWQAYQSGSATWTDLPWVQGIHGATTGQRQSLCRIELQLRPGDSESHDKQVAIPFFGSCAIYYQLER